MSYVHLPLHFIYWVFECLCFALNVHNLHKQLGGSTYHVSVFACVFCVCVCDCTYVCICIYAFVCTSSFQATHSYLTFSPNYAHFSFPSSLACTRNISACCTRNLSRSSITINTHLYSMWMTYVLWKGELFPHEVANC